MKTSEEYEYRVTWERSDWLSLGFLLLFAVGAPLVIVWDLDLWSAPRWVQAIPLAWITCVLLVPLGVWLYRPGEVLTRAFGLDASNR